MFLKLLLFLEYTRQSAGGIVLASSRKYFKDQAFPRAPQHFIVHKIFEVGLQLLVETLACVGLGHGGLTAR